ncbi:FACT complex subunit spt16-like [Ochlerotatus camptorhynchus]|uniref:FACT complex subunit spt16-like n=1 Tax=Ochlerotatus camptorhynchus TaxID=644619 RepID=UPI0031E416D4
MFWFAFTTAPKISNIVFDKDSFYRRIKRQLEGARVFPCQLKGTRVFIAEDGLHSDGGRRSRVNHYNKSTSLQSWLLAYELTDTITVLCEKSIFVLTNKKKIYFLKQIDKNGEEGIPSVELLVWGKNDKDKANFDKLLEAIKRSKNCKTLGVFSKEDFSGELCESWRVLVKDKRFNTVDLSVPIGYIMCSKEDSEVNTADADKKVKHAKLSEGVEQALTDKRYVSNTNYLDMCYPAIIQSGGNYSLKFSAFSDKNYLHFASIICALGVRYKSYYSNVVRTLLVNPTETIHKHYTVLLNLEEELLKVMIPGKNLSEVFNVGMDYAKKEDPS